MIKLLPNRNAFLKNTISNRYLAFSTLLCIILFSNSLFANPLAENDWVLKSETNGIKTFYKVTTCENIEVVLLKFENTNSYDVTISWNNQLKNIPSSTKFTLDVLKTDTAISSCDKSPVIQLSAQLGDGYPISIMDSINLLVIEVSYK